MFREQKEADIEVYCSGVSCPFWGPIEYRCEELRNLHYYRKQITSLTGRIDRSKLVIDLIRLQLKLIELEVYL